jgi:hypothetical protein
MKHPEIGVRFQKTHTRLYLAFQKPSAPEGRPTEDYALKYENWMRDRLNSQGGEIEGLYAQIIRDHVKPDDLQKGSDDEKKYRALLNPYPKE